MAQAHTQVKSVSESISRIQLSRTLGWSSTSATFTGVFRDDPSGGQSDGCLAVLAFGGAAVFDGMVKL